MRKSTPIQHVACALFIGVTLFLSGCFNMDSSYGTPIDSAKVANIVKGKTTRAEIESWFGKPLAVNLTGDGRRMLSYSYTSTQIGVKKSTMMLGPFARGEGSTRSQSLQVYVSKEGIVEDYEFSDNTRDIEGNGLNNHSSLRQ